MSYSQHGAIEIEIWNHSNLEGTGKASPRTEDWDWVLKNRKRVNVSDAEEGEQEEIGMTQMFL